MTLPGESATLTRFNGPDYRPERDNPRLVPQHQRIRNLMLDGEWRTLDEIARATGDPVASISAQLRHLRKPRFGSFLVDRRHVGRGLFQYRVRMPESTPGAGGNVLHNGDNSVHNVSGAAVLEHPAPGTERMVSMRGDRIPVGYCQCGCGNRTPIATFNEPRRGYAKGRPQRFCRGHRVRPSAEVRFWAGFEKRSEAECWVWEGDRDSDGYARLKVDGRTVRGHRFAYELLVGPIPGGLTIDHLCRNKACVNPAHMEPVTTSENSQRERAALAGTWSRTLGKVERYQRIADMRNAGATRAEISAALGMTPRAVDSAIGRMRVEGWRVLDQQEAAAVRRQAPPVGVDEHGGRLFA